MKKMKLPLLLAVILSGVGTSELSAEVNQSAETGFQVTHVCVVHQDPDKAFKIFVEEFGQWYDASHSYSLKAENLSIDVGKHCMLEQLPGGGYVRHMELVFYQPGKMLRLNGGLGPLQGMGVHGALTFQFEPVVDAPGQTKVSMTYNVSGASFLKLDRLSRPVDSVLGSQLDAYQKHVNEK